MRHRPAPGGGDGDLAHLLGRAARRQQPDDDRLGLRRSQVVAGLHDAIELDVDLAAARLAQHLDLDHLEGHRPVVGEGHRLARRGRDRVVAGQPELRRHRVGLLQRLVGPAGGRRDLQRRGAHADMRAVRR